MLVSDSQEGATGVNRHVAGPGACQQELLHPRQLVRLPLHLEDLNDADASAGDIHIQVFSSVHQNYLGSGIAGFGGEVHLLEQLQVAKSSVDPINLKDVLQLAHNQSNSLGGMQGHVTRSVTFSQFRRVAFQKDSVVPPVVMDDVAAQVNDPVPPSHVGAAQDKLWSSSSKFSRGVPAALSSR